MDAKPLYEEVKVTASQLLLTVRKLLQDTSVRRIVIKNASGRPIIDLPLFLGVFAVLLLPLWSLVAVIAGSAGGYTVAVEREPEPPAEGTTPPPVEATRPPSDRPQA
jgi:hypothetical protein